MRIDRSEDRPDQLIKLIYGTLAGSSQWSDVLEELCAQFGGSGSSLIDHNFGNRRGHIRFKCDHLDDTVDLAYGTRMCGRNPWLHSDMPYQSESVILGREILPDTELTKTEFYQDYLRPLGLKHRLCGVVRRDGLDVRFLSILRSADQGPFEDDDKARLRRVLPHLHQAVGLRRQLREERSEREALLEVLDHIPVACLLVNRSARVHFVNSAAEELLARRDGLTISAGCLTSCSGLQTARLRSAIANVAASGDDGGSDTHVVIVRPSNRSPILLNLFPIRRGEINRPRGGDSLVAVLTKDPGGNRLEPLASFAEAYRLTQAEARLVALLAEGQGLFQAAQSLGITRNTARTHMRHVYAKVGAHRQADLIRLLAKLGTA